MQDLSKTRKRISHYLTEIPVNLIAKTGVSPNTLTIIGFILSAMAAVLVARGLFIAAGVTILVAGLFDMLDGALARKTNRTTRFGAFLDSLLDRLSEGLLFLAIIFNFAKTGQTNYILIGAATLLVTQLVSYSRARAEAIGIECEVGFFTRAERVIVLAIGFLINQLEIILVIILIFSLISLIQRIITTLRKAK
jgi:CDP-diacylglycerol--glycerol-3-phosphate 3-phosphatidyltransferase